MKFFTFTFLLLCVFFRYSYLFSSRPSPGSRSWGGGDCSDRPDQNRSWSGRLTVFIIYSSRRHFLPSSLDEINATLTQSVKPSGSRLHLFRHGYTVILLLLIPSNAYRKTGFGTACQPILTTFVSRATRALKASPPTNTTGFRLNPWNLLLESSVTDYTSIS